MFMPLIGLAGDGDFVLRNRRRSSCARSPLSRSSVERHRIRSVGVCRRSGVLHDLHTASRHAVRGAHKPRR